MRHFKHFNSGSLQYVSDIHADANKWFPRIRPISKYLAVCGDIGVPTSSYCKDFLKYCSDNFERTIVCSGNHDYDCSPLYDKNKVRQYEPLIVDLIKNFKNIVYLNQSSTTLSGRSDDYLILGLTLWCNPQQNPADRSVLSPISEKFIETRNQHAQQARWLENQITHTDKKIIIVSHYVPTFRLIENRYKKQINSSYRTSFFATDLEHLLKPNVCAWLCGHTHSRLSTYIGTTYMGVNSYGYSHENSNRNDYPPIAISI